jgi:hypothetical protein
VLNNHGKIYYIFIRAGESRMHRENPGCARRIQGAREESRVCGENPGCARRIQGARGESRLHGDSPGYVGVIQVHQLMEFFNVIAGCLQTGKPSALEGDAFFDFMCSVCSPTGGEEIKRMKLSWLVSCFGIFVS